MPEFLSLDLFRQAVELLGEAEAREVRRAFLAHHLEPDSEDRRRRLGVAPEQGRDTYNGYIWDCLSGRRLATESEVWSRLDRLRTIIVMWDLHESYSVEVPEDFRFPIGTVIRSTPTILRAGTPYLPEDLYVFETPTDGVSVLTHEYIDQERFCLMAD